MTSLLGLTHGARDDRTRLWTAGQDGTGWWRAVSPGASVTIFWSTLSAPAWRTASWACERSDRPGHSCPGRGCETLGPSLNQDSRTRGAVPGVRQDGPLEAVVSWLVLVISGVLEAVWATALGRSEGLSRLGPTVVFFAALAASMAGLAYAMRGLPVGTSYAVWVGIGAVLTVAYAMATGGETVSALKVLFLAMIVGGVIGLKTLH